MKKYLFILLFSIFVLSCKENKVVDPQLVDVIYVKEVEQYKTGHYNVTLAGKNSKTEHEFFKIAFQTSHFFSVNEVLYTETYLRTYETTKQYFEPKKDDSKIYDSLQIVTDSLKYQIELKNNLIKLKNDSIRHLSLKEEALMLLLEEKR